ncbi:surface lipoprotein assembly modifier [Pseudooceanicola aestuarii]|uniref:surface lipoprotein assembly modifier n=1 Tax=Pseudooceanicola aestuarii TaxID=2697319 RepID=UPI001952EA11|nr:surface lipoprotein assembly modifier [Pseudooceanicola aestuarii]
MAAVAWLLLALPLPLLAAGAQDTMIDRASETGAGAAATMATIAGTAPAGRAPAALRGTPGHGPETKTKTGAEAAAVLARAEAQINAGSPATAIAALQALGPRSDRATELRRLWALAVAHVRAGRPRAALPQLERLVSLAPGNATYRLELATALERAGQEARARYHFDLSRGADLPAALAQEVDRRIDRIDRARTWEGRFRIALAPESNAARRTAAETVTLGSLPFRLNPAARARPAQGLDLGLGVTALPRLSPDLRLRLGLDLDARIYDGGAPDDLRLRGELGLLHLGDRRHRLGGGLLLDRRWIDGAPYSRSAGGYLTWGRALDAAGRSDLSLTLLRDRIHHDGAPGRDFTRSLAALRLTRVVTPRLQLRAGLRLEHRDSATGSEAGQGGGITLGGQYAFRGGLLADLELDFARMDRDAADAFFGIRRRDRTGTLTLRLTHRDWTLAGFAPVLEVQAERQRSSNAIYSFDNRRASLGLTRRF